MDEETLTFSELRKIQKTERRQEKLSELDENFFLKVKDYLRRKQDVDENSREYKNAKRVFRKILSLREDKIVKNARLSLKSNIKVSELNTLPREEELYREMKQKFVEHRERVEEITEGKPVKEEKKEKDLDKETEKKDENSQTPKEEEKPKNDDKEEKEELSPEDGYQIVEIISEVPEFMGTDLEAYGPFEEGDEAEIPEDNAEILVNRGNAELLS